jgi:hypothetical protein
MVGYELPSPFQVIYCLSIARALLVEVYHNVPWINIVGYGEMAYTVTSVLYLQHFHCLNYKNFQLEKKLVKFYI